MGKSNLLLALPENKPMVKIAQLFATKVTSWKDLVFYLVPVSMDFGNQNWKIQFVWVSTYRLLKKYTRQKLMLSDKTPPVIKCPENIKSVALPGKKYGFVNWTEPKAKGILSRT